MKKILAVLVEVEQVAKPIKEKTPDDKTTTWLAPKVTCEVEYASITNNQTYREPVFIQLIEY